MGRHFGNLARIRHIITFSLPHFEQKAFPNFFPDALPNTRRRFRGLFFRVVPHVVLVYMVYSWGNYVHEQSKRKNPADYENDE
ncbi:cytochrome b-c1 complex subunit 8-like [Nematolebias whitei]|uniref:cytochrome b-c1 complex subunit 8-like n=1 Tax=Nematolebias whitei TaxID=451745 RepID=UPI001897C51D|nr:cytochrome b-c1 complex subunit 8-like [Nematolebias whitei]